MGTFIWPPTAAGGTPTPGDLCECYFATRAEMAASVAPNYSPLMFNLEVGAPYLFVPGDVTTDDGWISISSLAGFAGRWLLQTDVVYLSPLGAGDDWARLGSAMAALAYKRRIQMRAGAWTCASKQITPAGTDLRCEPGVIMVSTLVPTAPPGGAEDASPFYNAGGNQLAASTTLNGVPVVGSRTMVLTNAAALTLLQNFFVTNVATGLVQQYTAVAIVGNTVTVDRDILRAFSNGDPVTFITAAVACRDILLDFSNALISGSGDRAVELILAQDCHVKGLNVRGGTGFDYFTIGLDIGSRDSTIEDCDVDGMGHAGACFAIEHANNCHLVRCTGRRATYGVVFPSNDACTISGGEQNACATGLGMISNSGADVLGCRNCDVFGGSYQSCTSSGIQISDGSSDVRLHGVSVNDCANGIYITGGASNAAPTNTQIHGAKILRGAQGLVAEAGTGHRAIGLTTEDQTTHHVMCLANTELSVSDAVALDSTTAGKIAANSGMYYVDGATAKLRVDGIRIESDKTAAGNVFVFQVENGSVPANNAVTNLHLRNALVIRPAGAPATVGMYLTLGTLDVDDYQQTGGSNGAFTVNANTTYRQGRRVQWDSSIVTPVFNAAPGQINFGSVTLIAGVGTFPWVPCKASDETPDVNRVSTGQGLVGAGYVNVTRNPGVGWVITSIDLAGNTVATDESTFDVWAP